MAELKNKADEYKEIFIKLHCYQRSGSDNLIELLTRYVNGKAGYTASYIDLVAERTGVSATGRITTTNADVMIPIVREIITIDTGSSPAHKDIVTAWEDFIYDFRNNRLR